MFSAQISGMMGGVTKEEKQRKLHEPDVTP
jgi:hypothetical protein